MCVEVPHSSEIRDLMAKAFKGALTPAQQQVCAIYLARKTQQEICFVFVTHNLFAASIKRVGN
jgi:hypothetical protein